MIGVIHEQETPPVQSRIQIENSDRRHDAYIEKLRRSVEAVQEYNAGLDDSDQFAITGSLLRQLTKVKPGKVA